MLKKLLILLLFAFSILGYSYGQTKQDSTQIRKGRLIGVSALAGTAYVGGMTGLYYLGYKDYEQSSFHDFYG